MTLRLSPSFTLGELSRTGNTALADANEAEARAFVVPLTALCVNVLQPIRDHFKAPVSINPGFRGAAVNAKVGGSKTSQHCKGEAADFTVPGADIDAVYRWIVTESGIKYGQCILEKPPGKAWIHASLGAPWRDAAKCGQALTFDGKTYQPWKPA